MNIQTKGSLMFEMMKIKEAVKTQNAQSIAAYYQEYLDQLKAPSKEVFRIGSFTVCSEKISFHLLSIYILLDLIDYCWNGEKFIRQTINQNPELMKYLSPEKRIPFAEAEDVRRITYEVHKISRTQLHIFLLPLENELDFLSAYTHPGNALLIFAKEQKDGKGAVLRALHQGLADFYIKKQLKEVLPYWAETNEEFIKEFIKWCNDSPSKFTAKKMR